MKRFLFSFFLLTCFGSTQAANFSYLIGGGGESKNRTLFDKPITYFEHLNQFAPVENQHIYFNGGHTNIESALKKQFPKTKKNTFTREDFFNFLEDLKDSIEDGKVKSGDQIMISIVSHGSVKGDNESSHMISLKTMNQKGKINLLNLTGADAISMDMLKEVVKLTEKNNIKLAIIDHSCYGGNAVALADNTKNVCVISGTNPNMVNYLFPIGFLGEQFNDSVRSFKKNYPQSKNLEEVVLKMSRDIRMPVMPHASMPKYLEITNKLSEVVEKYINPGGLELNQIPDCVDVSALKKAFAGVLEEIGEGEIYKQLPEYKTFIKELEDYENTAKKKLKNAQEFKKYQMAHKEFDDYLVKDHSIDLLDEKFKRDPSDKYDFLKVDFQGEVNLKELEKTLVALNYNPDQIGNILENVQKSARIYGPEVKRVTKNLKEVQKGTKSPQEIQKENSDQKYVKYFFKTRQLTEAFNKLRAKIYELNMNEKETNSCRNFKIN